MATYVMLTKLMTNGRRALRDGPQAREELYARVAALDGKIVSDYYTLGRHDSFTIFEAPDNIAAYRIGMEFGDYFGCHTNIVPAIDLNVFTRLLSQTTETTGPHKWQIRLPAQIGRRALRWYVISRHLKAACKPLMIEGRENLKDVKGPVIFIGNHSSHLDSLVMFQALNERYRWRIAFGSATDRWFIKGRKGMTKQPWWNSLSLNCWPIKRGGGRSSLEYGEWLIDKGWSLAIFPEGTRSTTGKMAHFRHGVSLIALAKGVPVVPIFMDGLREIRPKGSTGVVPGAVTAQIGKPIRFAPGTDVADATYTMYKAMDEMRLELHARRKPRGEHPPEASAAQ